MSAPTPPTQDDASPTGGAAAEAEASATPSRFAKAKSAYDLVSDIFKPKTIAILVAAAIIAITGAVGGWDNAATVEKSLPVIKAEQVQKTGPFTLSLKKAVWTDESKQLGLYKWPGTRYVLASVNVTNTSKVPVNLQSSMVPALTPDLQLPASAKGTRVVWFMSIQDGSTMLYIQPGLTYQVAVVWEQDASQPPPTQLAVTVNDLTYRQSSIDGSSNWTDPEPLGVVTIPVQEMPR